jgi:iron complex transport system permease protein
MTAKENIAMKSQYRKFTRRRVIFLFAASILLFSVLMYSLCVGSSGISLSDVWNALLSPFEVSNSNPATLIVWNSRLPRAIVAVTAGAALALAGVVTQISTRNPLASPFTLGISSAAGFGAALMITLGAGTMLTTSLGGFTVSNYYWLLLGSFFFSLISTFVIFMIMKYRSSRPEVIVLIGIAMNFLFSAAISFVQYFGTTEQVAAIVFWLFGSLSKVTWASFWTLGIVFAVAFMLLYRWGWKFNALYMGDDVAKSLGVDAEKTRLRCVTIASLITATVVSFLGIISFVCLVSPHIARLVVGGDSRYLIPASCLIGANTLLIADTVSRTIFLPLILPVGILTSFLGVPLFLYLIIRRKDFW